MTVARRAGTAHELHHLDPFELCESERPGLLVCEVTLPAVVLGSRQGPSVLDLAACASGGFEVVGRRSGGGVVVLRPGEVVWIDIVVPRGAPGVPDDVRGSMRWAGACWQRAVGGRVHTGGMEANAWSQLLCFAGLGPGEVVAGGRKLVGLSQRRTRAGARIQGLVHRVARPLDDAALLAPPLPPGEPATPATLPEGVTTDDVLAGLMACLE